MKNHLKKIVCFLSVFGTFNSFINGQIDTSEISLIELKKIREQELSQGSDVNSEAFKLKMREAQLVIEQLIWLTNLSENILKTTKVLLKP